ncbi:MAG: ferredoxin--NADP reductase [Pseudomonadales bacterium]|jgi:ferredoxin--NADP+ reductase|nr:ferredoxin--NADP reductase [Pseudomonadales bacterium]
MSAFQTEEVLWIRHWNERLFSFGTTRRSEFRFVNGQFVMVGLEVDGKPLMRAYSIASPNYEEQLEFFSIKVQDGPLTSRLQHLEVGDSVLVGRKPVGSLLLCDLRPGRNLYFLSTGTGMAPFLSLIRDPEAYERFDRVVLVHGVREVADLAYADYFREELPQHEYLGEYIRQKFLYYPTVTREPFVHQGRIPELIDSGRLCEDLGLPPLDPAVDRAMVCGSMAMLKDCSACLDRHGFAMSPSQGEQGDYVIERAFVG